MLCSRMQRPNPRQTKTVVMVANFLVGEAYAAEIPQTCSAPGQSCA